MKIYTKTGDTGETGLLGGVRVSKDTLRVEVYGTVDELNAVLGEVRASVVFADIDEVLETVQHRLFTLGAELATASDKTAGGGRDDERIDEEDVTALETAIDRFEATLPPLREFVLPGGTPGAAQLHFARAVCRRAERRLVTLSKQPDETVRDLILIYLNRLSDLLFVLARATNAVAGQADVAWRRKT